jgi:hypothetical protein
MLLGDGLMSVQNLTNCQVNDALHHMSQALCGAHYIIIYPALDTLRELYSNYVHKRIQDNNEIVLINPFNEKATSGVYAVYDKMGLNIVSDYFSKRKLGLA